MHTYTRSQTPSTRIRSPGWRIHGGVEDTKFSTNKQHTLSRVRQSSIEPEWRMQLHSTLYKFITAKSKSRTRHASRRGILSLYYCVHLRTRTAWLEHICIMCFACQKHKLNSLLFISSQVLQRKLWTRSCIMGHGIRFFGGSLR